MECPVPVSRKTNRKISFLSNRVRRLLKSGSMRGFTLVELAIVLIIVGLLIGVGANMVGPLTKRVKLNESRDDLNKAKEAVVSFSMSRGRLPCPDVNNDGLEDLTGAVCTACPNPPSPLSKRHPQHKRNRCLAEFSPIRRRGHANPHDHQFPKLLRRPL